MTFTGTFHLSAPVEGRVTGAVFIGQGTLRAEVPATPNSSATTSSVCSAPTWSNPISGRQCCAGATTPHSGSTERRSEAAPVPEQARRLASEFEARFPQRNRSESLGAADQLDPRCRARPAMFFASVRRRPPRPVHVVLDYQSRIPVTTSASTAAKRG